MRLAALDHNYNVKRLQAVISRLTNESGKLGKLRYRTKFSKTTDLWVVEPVKVR